MLHAYAAVFDATQTSKSPRRPHRQEPALRIISAPKQQFDRAAAMALVDAGYMPIERYVEMFDEQFVTPPYNPGNFGEGDI
jgi:hypothetical protein